jgi:CHASE2 domain-containing sensor protein
MSRYLLPVPSFRQVVMGVFFVVFTLLDPFGLSSSSDAASERWLNRMFASGYGHLGQQQIAVVLIDDAYLQRNGTFWPMPYDEQSKLFKNLLGFKPKAVFADLLYSHDHADGQAGKDSQLLANVFERYQRRGIPFFLANSGVAQKEAGHVNALESLSSASSPALVQWSGFDERYPLAVSTSMGTLETPALALYREYCRDRLCADIPADAASAVTAPPMAVQWGLNMPPEQSSVARADDCRAIGGLAEEFWKQLMHAVFWKLDDSDDKPVCRYALTLTATDLEVTDEQDRELIGRLIANRLVLVGADITSASDLTESPVNGLVPGVFLHAMALDNLITQGMKYDRDPESVRGTNFNWLDLLSIVLVGVIALIRCLHQRASEDFEACDRLTRVRVGLLSPLASWIVVLGFLWLLSQVLNATHITPVNVLGVLLISLVLVADAFSSLPKVFAPFNPKKEFKCSSGLCL